MRLPYSPFAFRTLARVHCQNILSSPSIQSTADILNDLDTQHFKRALLELRSDLLAVEQSGQEAAQTVQLDQTTIGRVSRMDALQGQAMAKESQQRRTIQLQRIEASLQRMEKGIFGLCLRCGEDIHVKRLAFDPTAPLCIACASQGEKR